MMEQEDEQSCIYKRLEMNYTYGLDKIYSLEEIEKSKEFSQF